MNLNRKRRRDKPGRQEGRGPVPLDVRPAGRGCFLHPQNGACQGDRADPVPLAAARAAPSPAGVAPAGVGPTDTADSALSTTPSIVAKNNQFNNQGRLKIVLLNRISKPNHTFSGHLVKGKGKAKGKRKG